MAVLVLVSTTSFTVNMHYCGGELVDSALLVQAEGCGMETDMHKQKTEGEAVDQQRCCAEKEMVFEGDQELKKNPTDHEFKDRLVLLATFLVLSYDLDPSSELHHFLQKDDPPGDKAPLYKLKESYLI